MRRYPPLAFVVAALLLAMFALPSALNLPVSNPGQSLEYAPVPGNQGRVNPGGNLAALGLGSSDTGAGGLGGIGVGDVPPPPPLQNTGGNPPGKKCVGNPPRQTEDPMSPPCVAFFQGDNGGATYEGVRSGEIRIVFYLEGGRTAINNSHGTDTTPKNAKFDLWQAPSGQEDMYVEWLRGWQTYFANRYQTYNRRPHFFVYFNGGVDTVAADQADASNNLNDIHPFAAFAYGDYDNAYETFMAQHGVLNFGGGVFNSAGSDPYPSAFYAKFPKLVWGFTPSADVQAEMFSSFICSKVAPFPAKVSGNAGENGQSRRYGLVYSTDASQPGLGDLAQEVQQEVARCGVQFVAFGPIPVAGNAGPPPASDPSYAINNMASFKKQGVTTIIWPGGFENNQSAAAASINYFPEWITWGGDHVLDEQGDGVVQNQDEWTHAWDVTSDIGALANGAEASCVDAYQSVNPNATSLDVNTYICHLRWSFYDDIRQLFTGIQVAGPRLTPGTMDQGFRAVPPKSSVDASSPACYYPSGDYTCVQDAMLQYWTAASGGSGSYGCYRMISAGRRFLPGQWPGGNVDAGQSPSDPCNTI